jgi:hypothetical protein
MSVVVDCEDANLPGQLGVALGRADTANNLQVNNFRPHLVKKHPPNVYSFYPSNSLLFYRPILAVKVSFFLQKRYLNYSFQSIGILISIMKMMIIIIMMMTMIKLMMMM